MLYLSGTIADVTREAGHAILILDTGRGLHRLQADAGLLFDGLTVLFGDDDWVGKAIAVQCNGDQLSTIEIPGAPPNYTI